MIDQIHDLYQSLEKHRIMLSFKGDLTEELTTALLDVLERKMSLIEKDPRVRKRTFNVVMECLQNLYHHRTHNTDPASDNHQPTPHGVVMIAQQEGGYSVLTGNYMDGGEVGRLREHLDRINGMGPDELRDLYKNVLSNGTFSSRGGGGLGMIEIARKSGGKLEYGFVPTDNDKTFFSLNVNVQA